LGLKISYKKYLKYLEINISEPLVIHMGIHNLPDSEKDIVDVLAKAGYLKASNDKVEISLESANILNVQPKGNVFGAKIKVEDNGSITPTLTFDTKKLREKKNHISPEDLIDNALEEFWENR
jgi:septum formation topological specificity factor MinE